MQFPLKYDYRDILSAPAAALAAKRILVMTLFLCAGLALYDLFCYVALAIEGEKVGRAFAVYGFFPFESFSFDSLVAAIVYWSGGLLALLAVMTGMTAVAAFEIEAIRGYHFLGIRKSIGFALSRFKQLFLSELSVFAFVLLIILLIFIYGLIGRIPFIGEWIYTVFFVLPGFVIAIFTVFILLVFILSVLLLPAVAAANRSGETFDSILETFSTIIRQPVRWTFYTLISAAAAKVFGFVYAYFAFRAVQFLTWSSSLGGGDNITNLVKSGVNHLPVKSDVAVYTFNLFEGIDWGINVAAWSRGSSADSEVSYFMAFMLFVIFASIFGYMLSVIATAQARAVVIIRKLKDDYNIADEKPLFYKEEHVNPKVEEQPEIGKS